MIGGISMEEAANNINSFMEYYNSGEWIKNSKSKYEELCEQMRALQNSLDPEDAHGKADDILCEALKVFGCNELVELYEQIEKWYA